MIEHHPAIGADRTGVTAPVTHVTVLEDRAQVRRTGRIRLSAGFHRLVVEDLAPVLQDVSLRAEVDAGRVADARVERVLRVRRTDKPEDIAALDARIEALVADVAQHQHDQQRAEQRLQTLGGMIARGIEEIPIDAVWGTVDPAAWNRTFDDLFQRGRELSEQALDAWFSAEDSLEDTRRAVAERAVADRLDQHLSAWALVDVQLDEAAEVELVLEYTVPNALWRPLHRAELVDDTTLRFTSRAAVWQYTGESWTDAELSFSTAQGSLGTAPPPLSDDPLDAERKPDDVELEMRDVTVQDIRPGGAGTGGGGPTSVELPGVDDGGETQELTAPEPVTVPDGGRPVFVDLETRTTPCAVRRVAMPERDPAVHLAVDAHHDGTRPLLAGPVELVMHGGPVGTTTLLFVAPGAPMTLGFGRDDAIRVHRSDRERETHESHVDGWISRHLEVSLFLSNLGSEPRTFTLTERIPVSEVEHVRITVDGERTTPGWSLDATTGFVTWTPTLEAHETATCTLDWSMSVAPGASL
jgi:uncharacterized protein (TIGR02231 family)